jgi:hypothetical protein
VCALGYAGGEDPAPPLGGHASHTMVQQCVDALQVCFRGVPTQLAKHTRKEAGRGQRLCRRHQHLKVILERQTDRQTEIYIYIDDRERQRERESSVTSGYDNFRAIVWATKFNQKKERNE